MKPTVALVRAESYASTETDRAVAEAMELAGGFECGGASVLVKPNMLNASPPDRAVTTNPAILRSFIRWLKRNGVSRIVVGDSPGWQSQESVGLRTGLRDIAASEGAEWADFSEAVDFENPEGRLVKRFRFAKALEESDLLVSLPKLKTHQLMYYTGAVKNLFGLVPGFEKGAFHLRFPARSDFAAMLADLAIAAKPDFALMDAVVAMEGPGPNSGRPRHLGLVMASRDALALDFAASELIGYEPSKIPYLTALAGRGGFAESARDLELVGLPMDEVRPEDFELIPVPGDTDLLKGRVPGPIHRIVRNLTVPRPRFDHKACVRCGGCVKICPAKALELREIEGGGRRVEIDDEACIRCYCCHEVCPEDAIRLVRSVY